MRIRWAQEGDEPAIEGMFEAQGYEYQLPDINSKNMVVRLVAVDDDNVPRVAAFGRRTIEAFILLDKNFATPQERYSTLLRLQNSAFEIGARLGYEDVQALIAAPIERRFGRRLRNEFGWEKNLWACYSRSL